MDTARIIREARLTEISHRAELVAADSTRGGFPRLTSRSSREDLIAWLMTNDPNGSHADALADAEHIDRHTLASAWAAVECACDEAE